MASDTDYGAGWDAGYAEGVADAERCICHTDCTDPYCSCEHSSGGDGVPT